MVGMDTPVSHEKPKEEDCECECVCAIEPNEEGTIESQPHDSEDPGALADDAKCNENLAILCPITPSPCRENGESVLVPNSPLSSESPKTPKSPDVESFNFTESDGTVGSGHDNNPRTPDEGIFDPFAPGPEELLLAPICKKLIKKSRKIVARRLNFDDEDVDEDDSPKSGDDVSKELDTLCEKTVLDDVYVTLLEAIFLKQAEDFFAENRSSEPADTATSPSPSLTGIAETCPGAPVKTVTRKPRNIDPGLCRKLEF